MDGFINVKKPRDFTSNDVVQVIKGFFPKTKIGHCGTLDPVATGVLVVCVGRAAKLQSYIMGHKKVYETDVVFGIDSPTLDLDGEYKEKDSAFVLDRAKLQEAVQQFCGEISQLPPLVSAIKKNGVPLYKLARKGIAVDVEPRQVSIESIEILGVEADKPFPRAKIRVTCSAGTYIRALARDIGDALGTCAVADNLVRVASGDFYLENAVALEDIKAKACVNDFSFLLPMSAPFGQYPTVVLDDLEQIRCFTTGRFAKVEGVLDPVVAVKDVGGRFLGIGKIEEKGLKAMVQLWRNFEGMPHCVETGTTDTAFSNGCVAAIGNFDGVHGGHRVLLEAMMEIAAQNRCPGVAVTFIPHPQSYFKGAEQYTALCSPEEKLRLISKIGVDYLVPLEFNENLANLEPRDFVEKILVKELQVKSLVVGWDFTFGVNAQGNSTLLKQLGNEYGFEVTVVAPVLYRRKKVSSSLIKQVITGGDMYTASRLLCGQYCLKGVVTEGDKIGRTINFPTANLDFDYNPVLPGDGVYSAKAFYGDTRHIAVCCIGTRPTIGDNLQRTVEVHILDDAPDLYGKVLTVEFYGKIRNNRKMGGLEELKGQIAADCQKARTFFKNRR